MVASPCYSLQFYAYSPVSGVWELAVALASTSSGAIAPETASCDLDMVAMSLPLLFMPPKDAVVIVEALNGLTATQTRRQLILPESTAFLVAGPGGRPVGVRG